MKIKMTMANNNKIAAATFWEKRNETNEERFEKKQKKKNKQI